MAVYDGNSSAGRSGDRGTPGADFPVSLAEVMNFRAGRGGDRWTPRADIPISLAETPVSVRDSVSTK